MDIRTQPDSADDDGPATSGSEHEARLDALRSAVKLGLDEIKHGGVDDPESALDRIEAMLDELEAAKRS